MLARGGVGESPCVAYEELGPWAALRAEHCATEGSGHGCMRTLGDIIASGLRLNAYLGPRHARIKQRDHEPDSTPSSTEETGPGTTCRFLGSVVELLGIWVSSVSLKSPLAACTSRGGTCPGSACDVARVGVPSHAPHARRACIAALGPRGCETAGSSARPCAVGAEGLEWLS